MKPILDPFFSRLLMALALYAMLVLLWMHAPAPPTLVQSPPAVPHN